MPQIELYENFNGLANGPLPAGYNGWVVNGTVNVVSDGTGKALASVGGSFGTMYKKLSNAGEPCRITAKVKLTDADFVTNTGDFFRVSMSDSTGANRRSLWITEAGNIEWFMPNSTGTLIANANIPLNEYLTFIMSFDGVDRYGFVVIRDVDGYVLASTGKTLTGDATRAQYALVHLESGLKTNQVYVKHIAGRNDFKGFSQNVPDNVKTKLYVRPFINGEDAFVTFPKNWQGGKGMIAGHGSGDPANFEIYAGKNYVDEGIAYAVSNTHGDTWGNQQGVSDFEALRQWMVGFGCEDKVYLFGYSHGGISCYNYATQYPQYVAKIITEAGTANLLQRYNAGRKSVIDSSFGVTRFEAIDRKYDPVMNPKKLKDIPLMIWVGNKDATVEFSSNGKLLAEKVAREGGFVCYLEEPGETHGVDYDANLNLNFLRAHVSLGDPNSTGNLVQSTPETTQLIKLSPNAVYKITTAESNILGCSLDNKNGMLTTLSGKESIIKTKARPMVILLKITNSNYSFSDVALIRSR